MLIGFEIRKSMSSLTDLHAPGGAGYRNSSSAVRCRICDNYDVEVSKNVGFLDFHRSCLSYEGGSCLFTAIPKSQYVIPQIQLHCFIQQAAVSYGDSTHLSIFRTSNWYICRSIEQEVFFCGLIRLIL